LKRAGDGSVYLTVCWIERCPSQSWIARVSCPSLQAHSRRCDAACERGPWTGSRCERHPLVASRPRL